MKNTIFLLAFFATFSILSGQSIDFAPVGAKWYYTQHSDNYPYPAEFRLVEVISEQVFQGQICRKILGLTEGCGLPSTSYVFTRNDSVFFWSPYTLKFQLLYDFRASLGSSWLIEGLSAGPSSDSLRVFVDSLSQRIIGADTLKVWHITNLGCYDWGNEIIEKVGNNYFLSPSFCLCENGPSGIRCYFDQSAEYHFVTYPCDTSILISGTKDFQLNNPIQISPNPFYESISIASEMRLNSSIFRLYDQMGIMVLEENLVLGITKIETGHLLPGIYFWQITASEEMVKTGQIIKITP